MKSFNSLNKAMDGEFSTCFYQNDYLSATICKILNDIASFSQVLTEGGLQRGS